MTGGTFAAESRPAASVRFPALDAKLVALKLATTLPAPGLIPLPRTVNKNLPKEIS